MEDMKINPIALLLGGEKEERVYRNCLKHGPLSISDLAKRTDIKRPTLYAIIGTLLKDGYVTQTQFGKRTVYDAATPDIFEKKMQEQEEEMKRIVPSKRPWEVCSIRPSNRPNEAQRSSMLFRATDRPTIGAEDGCGNDSLGIDSTKA